MLYYRKTDREVPAMPKISPHIRAMQHELRKNMTPEESDLWYKFFLILKRRKIFDFTHQEAINNEFIVDFCCDRIRLIIEVDGSQHRRPEEIAYDQMRTAKLEAWGYMVIRYDNKVVRENFPGVCQDILKIAKWRSGK